MKTVAELIAALSEHDPETAVVVYSPSATGGYADPSIEGPDEAEGWTLEGGDRRPVLAIFTSATQRITYTPPAEPEPAAEVVETEALSIPLPEARRLLDWLAPGGPGYGSTPPWLDDLVAHLQNVIDDGQ